MTNPVCPDCEEGPKKCKCNNGKSSTPYTVCDEITASPIAQHWLESVRTSQTPIVLIGTSRK